jgi:tryptophanyl-tRNA synthetase
MQGEYDAFIMQADAQALTDNFETPDKVHDSVLEVALDNLAIGLDPNLVTLFIQSQVPELAELAMYFMNLVTLSRVRRNPTVKNEMTGRRFGLNIPVGFAVYPIYQAADILAFQADVVPVGEDQMPMIEQAREIARRFNLLYGETFPLPSPVIGRVGRLLGTDGGAKMSKSLGNVIYLSDATDAVRRKVMSMYTDPTRTHAGIPGRVDGNPVFVYLHAFGREADRQTIVDLEARYKEGRVGDVDVKAFLVEVLERFLDPIRRRRQEYEERPDEVIRILRRGTDRARSEAALTLAKVRNNMKLTYF